MTNLGGLAIVSTLLIGLSACGDGGGAPHPGGSGGGAGSSAAGGHAGIAGQAGATAGSGGGTAGGAGGGGPGGGGAGGGGAGGSAGAAGEAGSGGAAGAGGQAGGRGGAGGFIVIIPSGTGGMAGGAGMGGGAGSPADTAVSGVLELVAGALGGPGNLDGVGTKARFFQTWATVLDETDNRLFVNDLAVETPGPYQGLLRAVDLGTGAVTSLGSVPLGSLHYRGGFLYVMNGPDFGLVKVSPADGHVVAFIPLDAGALGDSYPLRTVSWPDGDAMYQVSQQGQLFRYDTATGSITATPVIGFPSNGNAFETVMAGPTTILVSVTSPAGSSPAINEILSVDIPTATATVVGTVAEGVVVDAIDPAGQFVVQLDDSSVPIAGGAAPPFSIFGDLIAGPHGSVVILDSTSISSWDRQSPAPTRLAGLELVGEPATPPSDASLTFSYAPLSLTVQGNRLYVTHTLANGLAVVDLSTGVVSALSQPIAAGAAAVAPSPDGQTLYLTERSDCSVWTLGIGAAATPMQSLLPSQGSRCLIVPGGHTMQPWVTSSLALYEGSLLFGSDGVSGLYQFDLAAGTYLSRGFQDATGGARNDVGLVGMAIGSDGLVYAVDGSTLYRFDHALQTATVIGLGGTSVAADKSGHVYTNDSDTVWRYDIATGQMRRVVGVPGSIGVSLAALPASLNGPKGLAVTDAGDLLIGNASEYAVVRAHFQ